MTLSVEKYMGNYFAAIKVIKKYDFYLSVKLPT